MFGVLEVILRHDPVPGQNFGARQGQIAFIVSLKVLSIPHRGAEKPGTFISWGRSGSPRHSVAITFRIWAWLRHVGLLLNTTFYGAAVNIRMRDWLGCLR
jgi:hypothetical protein